MFEIEDDQSMSVLLRASDTDAVPTSTGCYITRIRLESYCTVVHAGEIVAHGLVFADIIDIPVSRIVDLRFMLTCRSIPLIFLSTNCIEAHHIEELVATVVVLKRISRPGKRNQSAANNYCRKLHIGYSEGGKIGKIAYV